MSVEADTFRCRSCKKRYCDEDGRLMAPGSDGKLRPSKGPAPRDRAGWPYVEPDGSEVWLRTCPLPKVPEWFLRLRQQHQAYERGVMLRDGGISNQPAAWLRAMEAFDSAKAEFQNRRQKREQKADEERRRQSQRQAGRA